MALLSRSDVITRLTMWIAAALLARYPMRFRARHGAEVLLTIRERLTRRQGRSGARGLLHAVKELAGLAQGLMSGPHRRVRSADRPPSPGDGHMASLATDLAYAVRSWRRSPGYTVVIVVTLGLGIGANTAIFSAVNGVLLRPLQYDSPEDLVMIWDRFDWLGASRTWVHDLQLRALREDATAFEGFAAMQMVSGRILGGDQPVHTDVARVSANFFDILGVRPVVGRSFRAGEDVWGASWVAVLSHDYWVREFGADSSVIGRKLVVGFPEMEVVGVLPEDFDYRLYEALGQVTAPDLWIPHQIDYAWYDEAPPGNGVAVLARLGAGLTRHEASEDLRRMSRAHAARFYGDAAFRYEMVGLRDDLVSDIRPALIVLLGTVVFVLMIAVANVATLVLARAHYRAGEFAVRYSLGATHGRVLRQLVTEHVALAVLGAGLGMVVATYGVEVLVRAAPVALPRAAEITIDLRVLAFTALVTLGAGIIPGVLPALQLRGTNLRWSGRAATETPRAHRVRHGLVIFQLALSVVLAAGAGLMIRSFVHLRNVDPGFRPERTLTFSIYLMQEYPTAQSRDAFFADLGDRIAALPGVDAVGATTALPLSAPAYGPVFRTQPSDSLRYSTWPGRGVEPDPGQFEGHEWVLADINAARPGYFRAAGIDVLAGREFSDADSRPDPPRVVIDNVLAESLLDGRDAIGRRVWVFNTWAEVVGVVRHAHHREYGETGRPQLYVPYGLLGSTRRTSVVVRGSGDPASLIPEIREAVRGIDPLVPIADIRTMEEMVEAATAERRFTMLLMSGFAVAAVLLAALGVYGVLAFGVAQRRREIAVRIAIGAPRGRVAWFVVRRGVGLAVVGLAIGLATTFAVGRVLDSLLFGVQPGDPATLVAAAAGLVIVALLASWLPARRAVSIEPVTVLRTD